MRLSSTALFVSPHFDDVALSCGGTVALQAQSGRAIVLTVFAGEPASELNSFARFQHDRWGTDADTVDLRRSEDHAAMKILGAESHLFEFRDAIYRGDLYLSDDDLFGPVKPDDVDTQLAVSQRILELSREIQANRVFLPLAIGGHVDHKLCHAARLDLEAAGFDVFFYEDFPYAASPGALEARRAELGLALNSDEVDISETVNQRINAISAYASQVTTIFRHYGPYADVVRAHASVCNRSPDAYVERFWHVDSRSKR